MLCYWRCLFFVLELHARYECWVMASNMHCTLFLIRHWCVLWCIPWKCQIKIGRSAYQTTTTVLETFCVWFNVAREIFLESYDPRHALVFPWYNIVCVYSKPIDTLLFRVQVQMTTNSCTLWLGTIHQMMALLPKMHCSIRKKLANNTTHYSGVGTNRIH